MKWLLVFFLAAVLVSAQTQDCPNDCSGNGSCDPQVGCVCEIDFAGADCSIPDKLIVSGVPMPGQSVPTREFRYFHLVVGTASTVYTNVLQTSSGGDIDTYVAVNTRPSKDVYDDKDITSSRNVTIVSEGVVGAFYVGLYGYISATATITVTVVKECPNDCSGAGTCGDDGICSCFPGHAGSDCSIDIITITDEQTITAAVAAGEFRYFEAFHSANQHDVVQFVVAQKESYPAMDCDLYVKYFFLPSLNFYDFRDVGNEDTFSVSLGSPREGHYYAGVYGNSACEFDITLYLVYPECPNNCSGPTHGTCDYLTYECDCDPMFTGEACETMVSNLGYDLSVEGYVGDNAWNYYTFSSFSSFNAQISVNQLGNRTGQDCDLYVARGRTPSFFDFDYRDISYEEEMQILIVSLGQNTYQIGVHGYTACFYNLSLTMVRSCLNNCIDDDHGVCMDGICRCRPGYGGTDCSTELTFLRNGVDRVDNVNGDDWVYYSLTVQPETRTTIYMSESLSIGYLWLYANVAHAGFPTLSEHELSDTETNQGVHYISIPTVEYQTEYIIGVHGSALAIPGQIYEYSVVSYQPAFS